DRGRGRWLKRGGEQRGEEERAEHVRGEGELVAVHRELALGRQDSGVVDEHVQLVVLGVEAAREIADGAERRDVAVPDALSARLSASVFAASLVARQQVDVGAEADEGRGGRQADPARG